MSMVPTRSSSPSALASRAAFCRSAKGAVVEARWTAATSPRSGPRQSRPASTARVRVSSSQLHIARSPRPSARSAGENQELASTAFLRLSLSRGT